MTGHLLENAKQYAQHSSQRCQSGWRCGNTPGGNLCKLELVDSGQPVEHGADADTRRSTGKTPTIPSAKDGEDILRRLSSHENVNVSQKDMNNRDAQSWACVSGSCSVVERVVTKMQGIGEWRTRCSAALPHVLTSEAPDALLNALHRHEDDGRRAEMLKAAESKADGNAGHYGRSRSPRRLAMRFTYAVQQIQGERDGEDDTVSLAHPRNGISKRRHTRGRCENDQRTNHYRRSRVPSLSACGVRAISRLLTLRLVKMGIDFGSSHLVTRLSGFSVTGRCESLAEGEEVKLRSQTPSASCSNSSQATMLDLEIMHYE